MLNSKGLSNKFVDGFIGDTTFRFFEGKLISAGFRIFSVWSKLLRYSSNNYLNLP